MFQKIKKFFHREVIVVSEPVPPQNTDYTIVRNSSFFDSEWYIRNYCIKKDADPVEHFCNEGWQLMYDPSPFFSVKSYLEKNPDVRQSHINPLVHFEIFGKYEFRSFSCHF